VIFEQVFKNLANHTKKRRYNASRRLTLIPFSQIVQLTSHLPAFTFPRIDFGVLTSGFAQDQHVRPLFGLENLVNLAFVCNEASFGKIRIHQFANSCQIRKNRYPTAIPQAMLTITPKDMTVSPLLNNFKFLNAEEQIIFPARIRAILIALVLAYDSDFNK